MPNHSSFNLYWYLMLHVILQAKDLINKIFRLRMSLLA
jgi:hypothetical protein